VTAQVRLVCNRGRRMPASLPELYFRQIGGARRILDVGCDTGDLGCHASGHEADVFGVDIDVGALEQPARFERVIGLDLESGSLPYADASFNAVVAKDIFEYVHHPGLLAREVARVTPPGGVVIASMVMARPRTVWADYAHVRGFTRHTASPFLEDAGLRVEPVGRMGGVPLTGRLGLVWLVATLLRLQGCNQLWASSWELRSHRP
jgi:SAM-dependent methyltransferase